ncbi:MAG: multidrug effflux MFS transporter [Thermoleophilia bacterium]
MQASAHLSQRQILVLVAVLGGVFSLGALATDLYQPGLPTMADDLGIGTRSAQMTITALLAGLALGQLAAGPLSDSLGRRRPLLVGLALFVASSIVCAVAPSALILTIARVVQGMAAAAGVALGNAVVTDYFRDREAARVLSRLVLVSYIVPVLAPLVGSVVLRLTSWRGLFVTMAIVGAVLLMAVAVGLRESLPRQRRAPADTRALLKTLADLRHDRGFVGLTLSAALMYGAFFAYLTGVSFVMQRQYGASPLLFSVLFSVNALGMMAASQLNHMLLARLAPRTLHAAGLSGCLLAGTGALIVAALPGTSLLALEVPLFALVFCVGLATPDVTALALSRHPNVAGSAAAGFGTVRLGLASATTPLVGIGGTVAAVPMAAVMVASSAGALAALAAVWRRVGGAEPAAATLAPAETAEDVAVG